MESKLYLRTKNLLSFLSHNNLIDDSTSQEILNTLDTIKNTNDKDDEYVDIYKSLLWDLLQDGKKNNFNEKQFNEIINDIYNKQAYISFYNEYLYEISDENINRKKRLAEENKKEIMDKYFERYGNYPDKKKILKLADPILRGFMDF